MNNIYNIHTGKLSSKSPIFDHESDLRKDHIEAQFIQLAKRLQGADAATDAEVLTGMAWALHALASSLEEGDETKGAAKVRDLFAEMEAVSRASFPLA